MAADADTPGGELSETSTMKTSPTSPNHTDEGSSALPKEVTPGTKSAEPIAAEDPELAEGCTDEAQDYDAADEDAVDKGAKGAAPTKKPMSHLRLATVIAAAAAIPLTALVGWLGFRTHQSHQAQEQRQLFLQVGRQGALNLTTIDWHRADTDVQRILDSATGNFYDDFSKRQQPFIQVVKKAQSTSVGTITEAGLESESRDEARVLVAVSVKTLNLGGAEQAPRAWRMRISVQKVGDEAKVSNVQFVP
jgi:Mce-associated membrane protein